MQNKPSHENQSRSRDIRENAPESVRHLNQKQLARRWGLSTRCLERWRGEGRGPAFITLGRRVLYRLADIEAFEFEHRHEGAGDQVAKDRSR